MKAAILSSIHLAGRRVEYRLIRSKAAKRLRVRVGPEGNAQQVELKQSSGYPRLDQSALETVPRWRFVPARRGETPVAAWVLVPVVFALS